VQSGTPAPVRVLQGTAGWSFCRTRARQMGILRAVYTNSMWSPRGEEASAGGHAHGRILGAGLRLSEGGASCSIGEAGVLPHAIRLRTARGRMQHPTAQGPCSLKMHSSRAVCTNTLYVCWLIQHCCAFSMLPRFLQSLPLGPVHSLQSSCSVPMMVPRRSPDAPGVRINCNESKS